MTASTGSITNPFQYTAREFDGETAIYYYRGRFYDPQLGRFISEDPIGYWGGVNLYDYVANSPVDLTDPFGLCGDCDNLLYSMPAHPPDANVDDNMRAATQNGYRWWYNQVSQWHGPWDYKNYKGRPHPEWDDFGNYNYGATGCALGIPLDVLLRFAGYAKSKRLKDDPYGKPYGRYPYGNQPEKQQQIIDGYTFCKKCQLLRDKD